MTFGNGKKLFYFFEEIIKYLETCSSKRSSLDLASFLKRHKSLILTELAVITLCWEFINQLWSRFSARVTRENFLYEMKKLDDLVKKIDVCSNNDLFNEIKGDPWVDKAIQNLQNRISVDEIDENNFLNKFRVSFIAMVKKVIDHQDNGSSFTTVYKDDLISHTNVSCESVFGRYKFYQQRFQNMAVTTLNDSVVAISNKTDDYIHNLESQEVARLLANRRRSREFARQSEQFQMDQRHESRKKRDENVSQKYC